MQTEDGVIADDAVGLSLNKKRLSGCSALLSDHIPRQLLKS